MKNDMQTTDINLFHNNMEIPLNYVIDTQKGRLSFKPSQYRRSIKFSERKRTDKKRKQKPKDG